MSETTSYEDQLSHETAAELLEELAAEFRGPDGPTVRVGNKRVRLTPSQRLEYGIEIEERSPMLGADRQEVTITLAWDVADDE